MSATIEMFAIHRLTTRKMSVRRGRMDNLKEKLRIAREKRILTALKLAKKQKRAVRIYNHVIEQNMTILSFMREKNKC